MPRAQLSKVLVVLALLPSLVTPALEIWLNTSDDKTDPAALLAGLFTLTLFAIVVWILYRPTFSEIGCRLGTPSQYWVSLSYVMAVVLSLTVIALVAGEVETVEIDYRVFLPTLGLIFISTFIVGMLTEEGFFRGMLWGALARHGTSQTVTLWLTSLAFAAWHIYLPFVEPEFAFERFWQVPIYFINITLISIGWGWIRMASGSLVLCCLIHALWNALVYSIFGAGNKPGITEIESIWIYCPERGLLGIAINFSALLVLTKFLRTDHPCLHRTINDPD